MQWLPIETHRGVYEVSSGGAVRRVGGRCAGQWVSDHGYAIVRLSSPRVIARVHRLVATAFIPNPNGFPVVNHLDSNRLNNNVENLEWCTQWSNLKHAADLGRMQRDYWVGKRSPSARLTDEAVAAIRNEYSLGGVSWENLGKKYGVSKRSIGRIVCGESYV